jgi:EF-P beta-lysylation protein EpmB
VLTEALSDDRQDAHDWQSILRAASIPTAMLLRRLQLESRIDDCDPDPDFRCLVTQTYIEKITPGDFDDPLLRQILPLRTENDRHIQLSGRDDPVGDLQARATTGLLHKYHGRALMIATAACAVHCRYCFRRNYPYHHASLTPEHIGSAIEYISDDPDIDEVILSGGDPLVLSNERLASLIAQLEPVSQLSTLRIHSRLPVVLPERIDAGLLRILSDTRLQVVIVIHCNHARELQQSEQSRLAALKDSGISLLNQSVLLRGVNDNAEDLIALSKRLFACHTLPYYLHMLDPTRGAMHFHVDTQRALDIHRCLTDRLPGYLVPRLVREQPGMTSKTAISRI